MRRSLAIVSLALAWLCANGAVLDVAQVFAWSRMFTGYARDLSVGDAMRETFDPAKRCPICEAIAMAKQSAGEQAPAAIQQGAGAKIVLVPASFADPVIEPRRQTWRSTWIAMADARVEPVPVPPPRAV